MQIKNPGGKHPGFKSRYRSEVYFFFAAATTAGEASASRISFNNTSVVDAAGGGAGGSAFFIAFEIFTNCIKMNARIKKPITIVMKLP